MSGSCCKKMQNPPKLRQKAVIAKEKFSEAKITAPDISPKSEKKVFNIFIFPETALSPEIAAENSIIHEHTEIIEDDAEATDITKGDDCFCVLASMYWLLFLFLRLYKKPKITQVRIFDINN